MLKKLQVLKCKYTILLGIIWAVVYWASILDYIYTLQQHQVVSDFTSIHYNVNRQEKDNSSTEQSGSTLCTVYI